MGEKKPNFMKKSIQNSNSDEPAFKVFLDDYLIAEVRGDNPDHLNVIPMRELTNYEEDKFNEYIASLYTDDKY